MDGTTITRHDSGTHGEYRAVVSGSDAIGRLTYQRRGSTLVADHTLVHPKSAAKASRQSWSRR